MAIMMIVNVLQKHQPMMYLITNAQYVQTTVHFIYLEEEHLLQYVLLKT